MMSFKLMTSLILLFSVCIPARTHAESFLPTRVGQKFTYTRSDSALPPNSWTVTSEVIDEAAVCSGGYFLVHRWNYRNQGETVEMYMKSTDTALYACSSGVECIVLQSGVPGTTWTCGDTVTEIMDSESVTVPYGGPYTAVVNRKYDQAEASPYWYEYVVPGLALVQEVDYWTSDPPKTQQLVDIQDPIPVPAISGRAAIMLCVMLCVLGLARLGRPLV